MQVKCKSGLTGTRERLQARYQTLESFRNWADTYGIHTRLGYKTIEGCWRANPLIESSVNPSDLRVVKRYRRKVKK